MIYVFRVCMDNWCIHLIMWIRVCCLLRAKLKLFVHSYFLEKSYFKYRFFFNWVELYKFHITFLSFTYPALYRALRIQLNESITDMHSLVECLGWWGSVCFRGFKTRWGGLCKWSQLSVFNFFPQIWLWMGGKIRGSGGRGTRNQGNFSSPFSPLQPLQVFKNGWMLMGRCQ